MNDVVSRIEKHKVVVICRGVYGETLHKLIDALYKGGIRLVEVTFDQSDVDAITKTGDAIRLIAKNFPEILVGSGTATKVEHVQATKDAGGQFVLSPNVNLDVIRATKELGMVSIPGALTPTEMLQAHDAGADIVKVFPAGWLGLKYIKDVQGPINHVKFMAAAGVNEENFSEYLDAGYCSAGISGRLIDRAVIASGDFEILTERAKTFMEIANNH